MTDCRVSAWTKSISSSAETGSSTSQPNSRGTRVARRRATSAPSGFDTPVMSTRLGTWGVMPPDYAGELGIDAAHGRRVGDPLHGQGVRREAHVDVLVHRGVEDLVERPCDHVVQLGVDLLLLPQEGMEVRHALDV